MPQAVTDKQTKATMAKLQLRFKSIEILITIKKWNAIVFNLIVVKTPNRWRLALLVGANLRGFVKRRKVKIPIFGRYWRSGGKPADAAFSGH
ncbi:hypothetical protein [Pantoea sp. BL1]|uniref:hypothetical protein n=1 Tax=Pantoea sp. BL1 TaxID=1628190 RepID=UPI0018CF1B1E|nr:hypothetical protein [Pantoea sp. BL1]